ncbi:hypothetical protein MNEG_4608, partial [Monoraphidium neglectum]
MLQELQAYLAADKTFADGLERLDAQAVLDRARQLLRRSPAFWRAIRQATAGDVE